MNTIIGQENAGFEIIEAMNTSENKGFCIGKNKYEYVTWWYVLPGEGLAAHFYHGHYFRNDPDAPAKSLAKVKADWCRRLADSFEELGRYGH